MLRKQALSLMFLLISLLSFPSNSYSVTEFICRLGQVSGDDYSTAALWEDAIDNAGDITNANCEVYGGTLTRGTIADGTAITQTTSGATGVCIHHTATQMLIDTNVGTENASGTWYPTVDGNDATNAWTPTDDGAAS